MGVILDSSILIAGERRRDSVWEVLERVEAVCGKTAAALSAVTAVELTHGIYRAKTDADRERREVFVEELYQAVAVHSAHTGDRAWPDASMASRWARALTIAFPDLLIGATALHLGFDVVTLNERHFQMIPGLKILSF